MTPKIAPAQQRRGSFLPTPDQHLLLRAALGPIETFDASYAAWTAAIEVRGLDLAAYQVIQLLAPRVRGRAADPVVAMVREQHRLTWARTKLTASRQPAAIRGLREAGIEAMVLKGAALVPLYYQDAGLRAVGDLDVLVAPQAVQAAADALARDGWRPAIAGEVFDPRFAHALTLEDGKGGSVDIHAHALSLNTGPADDERFWAKARALTLGGEETRTLCAAHQLIHQIAHAAAWNVFPAVRWAADGVMIIASGEVDWSEFEAETLRLGLSPVMAEGLGYLANDLDQPVPTDLIGRLAAAPVPRSRMSHLRRETAPREGLWAVAALHWWRLRVAAGGSPGRMLRMAPAYCRYRLSTGASGPIASLLRGLGLGAPQSQSVRG